jgi:hypothetical protein
MPTAYKRFTHNLDGHKGDIYKVIFEDEKGAVLEGPNNHEKRSWWSSSAIENNMVEYKEPVVEKFTRVVLRSFLPGNVFTSNIKHTHTNEVIGHVEFILTDGKLTDVRVIDV